MANRVTTKGDVMAQAKSLAADIRQQAENRLKEVRKQIEPLKVEESELVAMLPQEREESEESAPTPAPQPEATPRRRRRRRRGGTRSDQAVEIVKDNPGITATEIAKKMDIKSNYLYRVLNDLVKEKRVKKDGKTYQVA